MIDSSERIIINDIPLISFLNKNSIKHCLKTPVKFSIKHSTFLKSHKVRMILIRSKKATKSRVYKKKKTLFLFRPFRRNNNSTDYNLYSNELIKKKKKKNKSIAKRELQLKLKIGYYSFRDNPNSNYAKYLKILNSKYSKCIYNSNTKNNIVNNETITGIMNQSNQIPYKLLGGGKSSSDEELPSNIDLAVSDGQSIPPFIRSIKRKIIDNPEPILTG
jgi:hypothetical protein